MTWRSVTARAALGVGVFWLLALPGSAQDNRTDTLASGQRGLPYFTYGLRLVKLLPAYRVRNEATTGSGANLEMLADGHAAIGFAQVDAYGLALRRDADRYGKVTVVGRLTDECVFLAQRREGPVTNLAGLGRPVESRKPKVAVGDAGSGMASTWSMFVSLRPELGAAEVVERGGALALNQLSIGMLDAVGWISDPRDLDHVLMRAVGAAPDLALMQLGEGLEHTLEDGTKIYERRSIAGAQGEKAEPLETVCTVAGVFAGADANPRLVEAVSRVLSLEREQLLRQE